MTTATLTPAAQNDLKQYLTFMLAGEMFAIGILHIKEIIEYGNLTEVPLMPNFIRGVINLRGSVVPVIDLAARFSKNPTKIGRRTCIVIIEAGENEENRQEALRLTKALLEEQEAEKQKAPVVPLYSYKVFERLSAGTGYTYFGDGNYDEVFYDEEIDHDFASWVFGDSMEPTYLNGEVVLIKQTGFDYDGAVYAVDWDGQTYIKKVYREEDGLRLVSLNKRYGDKFAPYDEDPRIIGKIVGNFMPIEA